MPRFDYNLWKWRALYRRRLFFFSVLQAVLVLNWLTARRISHHTQSWAKNGQASTGYRKFYEDLPVLFYISHGLLLVVVLFTKTGRSIVHESQGKRLCDWSAFSLVLALIYLLVPLNTIYERELSDSRDISFTALSLLGIALFQHLGVSEPVLSLTIFSIAILWIIYLCCVSLSAVSVISICIIVLAFGVLTRMQEYEFHRTFDKQKDMLQGSSYAEMTAAGGGVDLHGSLGGMVFGGNLAVFLEDTVTALKAMESAIALQEDLLNRDDLLMECEFKVIHHSAGNDEDTGSASSDENDRDVDILAPVSASAAVGKEQEVVSWKLTSHAASLQVNKMLCQALYHAVAHSEENSRVSGTSFSFNKICNQLFALFEGVRGNSLTLYANETVSEVLISAPKQIFELIIFLLLHDAVNSEDRRIVCLSCETSSAHGWHISIQSLMIERLKENRYHPQTGKDSDASTVVSGSSGAEGLRKIKGAPVASSVLNMNNLNISRTLLLNENVTKRNRPMERLAERLTMKYLKSSIQHVDPEYRAGVCVEQKIIPLTSDRCMLAPTHESLTFARTQAMSVTPKSAARQPLIPAALGPDGNQLSGELDPSSGNITGAPQPMAAGHGQQAQPSLPQPQQPLRADQDLQQWLFVVQRSHDLEGMGEIKEKMKQLCVPFRVKALSELRDPLYAATPLPFAVMLIDETFLSKLLKDKDKSKFKYLRGLHLKWVVVSDPKKLSSATDIKVLYGIDGDSLSGKASMSELFECVQSVTQKLPPRTSPDAHNAFDDSEDPDSLRYRSQSSSSMPSFGVPFRRGVRGMDRSDVEAVKRWLLLVRQFKAVASKLPTIDPVLLNGLDARMKDIESLRDVQDNPDSLLAVPSYAGPLADMNTHKKRAKHIMDTYQPLLAHLKVKLENFDLFSLQGIAAKCAVQSSTLGLLHLSAWFTTLQEIVSITMNIMDTNATRSVADGADKSVSFSFTSAGKALTSRSKPSNSKSASHSSSAAGTAALTAGTGAGAGAATEMVNGVAVRKGMDIMTLDDVSEHEHEPSQSFLDDGDRLGELPRVDAAATQRGAGASSAAKPAGAASEAPPVVSAQFKMVDAGLRSIIGDMVRAIEVAVWDAAMER